MKFTIVERKMKIDDDLRAYALRKVEKLDRYFQQDSDTTITRLLPSANCAANRQWKLRCVRSVWSFAPRRRRAICSRP